MAKWANWKKAEAEVAKAFEGVRISRINYSEVKGDISHKDYSIEVKYGKQVPKSLRVKVPTVILTKKNFYYLIPVKPGVKADDALRSAIQQGEFAPSTTKKSEFLDKCFDQARKYSEKKPIVCVKAPRMQGFVCAYIARTR